MAFDQRLLEILRCPVTGQALTVMDKRRLGILNQAITRDGILKEDGARADSALEAALITHDDSLVYRIEGGIPVMLTSEAIRPAGLFSSPE